MAKISDFKVLHDGRIVIQYGNSVSLLYEGLDGTYKELCSEKIPKMEDSTMRCQHDQLVVFNQSKCARFDVGQREFLNSRDYVSHSPILDVAISKSQGYLIIAEEAASFSSDAKKSNIILLDLYTLQFHKKCQSFLPISHILLTTKKNHILVKEDNVRALKTYDWEREEVIDVQYTPEWEQSGCVAEVKNFFLIGGNGHITVIDKVHLKVVGYLSLAGVVKSICQSGDHMTIFVQNDASHLYAFDARHNPIKKFTEFDMAVAVTTRGGNLLVAQQNGAIHVVDLKTKKGLREAQLDEKVTDICAVPFEKHEAILCIDQKIPKKVNIKKKKGAEKQGFGDLGLVRRMYAYEAGGKRQVLFLGRDLCKRFDYKSCKEQEDLKQKGEFVACDYLPNLGVFIVGTAAKEDDNVFVVNASGFKKQFKVRGQSLKSPYTLEAVPGGVTCVSVNQDKQYYAIGGANGTIRLCLVRQLALNLVHQTLDHHRQRVTDLSFFKRGHSCLLISASADRTIAVYSLHDHHLIYRHSVGKSIQRVLANPQIDEVIYMTEDKYVYRCALSDSALDEAQKGCSLQYSMTQHFLQADEEQQLATIKFIRDQLSVFDKTNLVSLCAFNGDTKGLVLSLQHDVPYMMNHEGKTAFDDCLRMSDFTAMNAIYQKICESDCVLDEQAFLHSLGYYSTWTAKLLNEDLFRPSQFLAGTTMPLFGELRNGRDHVLFADQGYKLHQQRLEDFVNFKAAKKKLIECAYCRIPLNLMGGSAPSMSFLKQIEEAKDDFLFGPLALLIEYKWQHQFSNILIYNSIYFVYVLLHTGYIVWFFGERWALFNLLVINFALFCFEVYQMVLEGCGRYLLQIGNYFDIAACTFMILYSLLALSKGHESLYLSVLLVATAMHTSRGILTLKIFTPIRQLIYKAQVLFDELIPFVVLLLSRIFLFAVLDLIVDKLDGTSSAGAGSLASSFAATYMVLFGEYPDLQNLSEIKWALLFLQTVAVNIVFLTLLIQLVANAFDRMKRIEQATDLKYMASMMLEVELNQSWNRKKGYKRYIHWVKYAEGEDRGPEEWHGKVRAVQDMIGDTNARIDKLAGQMEQLAKEVRESQIRS